MKPVWTVGKKRKNKHNLSKVKLKCESNELTIVTSLKKLKSIKSLSIFDELSSVDCADTVGSYGNCHYLDQVNFKGDIYLLNNDQDGLSPNIDKVTSKLKSNKDISFFINSSDKSTSDFIDEAVKFKSTTKGHFVIKDDYLVFFSVPQNQNISKKFSSNIKLFIKDRVKKKKLIKLKIPNGFYLINEVLFIPKLFEMISEISEPGELLGYYIGKKTSAKK